MKKPFPIAAVFLLLLALNTHTAFAQSGVPNLITYQGRVTVGGQPFTGNGQFKFALVNDGTNTSRTAIAFATYPGGVFFDSQITDGGAGYTTPPTVTFNPINPGGSGGMATATVSGGAVTAITINNYGTYQGFVYLVMSPPPVSLGYTTYWSHDNTSASGSAPTSAVALPVANGLFVVPLGDTNQANMAAFPASVMTNDNVRLRIWFNDGTNGFAQLAPDQPLTAAPYALVAQRVDGASAVALNNSSNTFSGNGAGLVSVNASTLSGLAVSNFWKTGGNAGTTSQNFLGTTDTQPLEVRVNGQRAMMLTPDSIGNIAPGIILGGVYNYGGTTNQGVTIGGGNNNAATAPFATIAGGASNHASGNSATVGGGSGNLADAEYSTVAGGHLNHADGDYAVIGGGKNNVMQNGLWATIAGGEGNYTVQPHATISGGKNNTAFNIYSTVGGGETNYAGGTYSTVPGGFGNKAMGAYSFAAGKNATANHDNSFIWSDGSDVFGTVRTNSFNVLAKGGYEFYTGSGIGVRLAPNGTSWAVISDRNAKKNFTPLDGKTVLAKLAAVPVAQWNYKWEQDSDVPNIGPMAQDFKAAFYPGRDDKSITTLEFDGVEMAAIQGLNQKLEEQKADNAELKAQLAELQVLVKKLAEERK